MRAYEPAACVCRQTLLSTRMTRGRSPTLQFWSGRGMAAERALSPRRWQTSSSRWGLPQPWTPGCTACTARLCKCARQHAVTGNQPPRSLSLSSHSATHGEHAAGLRPCTAWQPGNRSAAQPSSSRAAPSSSRAGPLSSRQSAIPEAARAPARGRPVEARLQGSTARGRLEVPVQGQGKSTAPASLRTLAPAADTPPRMLAPLLTGYWLQKGRMLTRCWRMLAPTSDRLLAAARHGAPARHRAGGLQLPGRPLGAEEGRCLYAFPGPSCGGSCSPSPGVSLLPGQLGAARICMAAARPAEL